MTAREHMERYARRVNGGLAWESALFRRIGEPSAGDLIDAAVDIAWDNLMPENALEHPSLEIVEQGALLVMRLAEARLDLELPLAA